MDRDHYESPKIESDPLAELARLIGQTDPHADFGREEQQPAPIQRRSNQSLRPSEREPDADGDRADGPPPWMQHRNPQQQQQPVEPSYPSDVHPLRRYAAAHHLPEPSHQPVPPAAYEASNAERYDDALYGPVETDAEYAAQRYQLEPNYQDEAYAYQDGYADDVQQQKPRRGGFTTVMAVVVLAVVGTGAAFAYRTYMGSPRSGEPPIIKADVGPNKVIPPSSAENASKQIQDRMAAGNAAEQLVSREEQPVDVKDITKSGPRVVFPPLNQNANPPSTASVAPGNRLAANAGNAAVAGTEPRKIKTLTVRSDEANAMAAAPVAAPPAPTPAPPATTRAAAPTAAAHAPSGNAPLSLAPQAAANAQIRVASANPSQPEPSVTGGYVVQVSSQRSEADAKASFKALQHKFPSSFGSRTPLIKRADLGSRGIYYRAMVGPFATSEQAVQFCGGLKAAGGQCVVQRN
jgi:hypothetical protein